MKTEKELIDAAAILIADNMGFGGDAESIKEFANRLVVELKRVRAVAANEKFGKPL
jgi:hypothetical protein